MTDVDNPEARVEQRKWIWVMLKRYSDGEDEE